MTRHDDETAAQGGHPRPEDAVSENTARNRHQQHCGAVGSHNNLAGVDRQSQPAMGQSVGDEVDEDGAHAIPREPLPHFYLEHPRQTAGVAQE